MLSLWGTMKIKDTMVLGEDFYSLAFYGYYKQPEELITQLVEEMDNSTAVRNLNTLVASEKINDSYNNSLEHTSSYGLGNMYR